MSRFGNRTIGDTDPSGTPVGDTAPDLAGPRALTARSVLLSVLLGTDPPRLPVGLLVRTTELFGLAEGTSRTALSRMVASGELVAEDGWYAIGSERLLRRQARQSASRRGDAAPWERGDPWRLAVVVAEGRRAAPERAALRAALTGARLAELREGVWLRPDNLTAPATDGLSGDDVLIWFRSTPEEDPAALARRLWDLEEWSRTARALRDHLATLVDPLEVGDRSVLAEGFVLSAAVLRHLQADPLLPAALLPDDWPGDALRADYERYDAAYRAVLGAWFDERR